VLDSDPMGTQRPPQQPLPTFQPMSIVAKRSPISAAAGLLSFLICPQIIRFFWIGSKKDDLALVFQVPFSALTLFVGGQDGHPACKILLHSKALFI